MRLQARLRAVADAIPAGASVVDIGSGDGQLSVWLAGSGRCRRVVASELRSGPFERAQERLQGSGVELRLGDGFTVLKAGEVEVAVLAGMGGRRMLRLIESAAGLARTLRLLVLQPMQQRQEVRAGLESLGFAVVDERRAIQRGRQYTLLLAVPVASG